MKKIAGVIVAASLALSSWCAWSADLAGQDASDLRQRAQEYQNERLRNPEFQPGQGRVSPEPAETRAKPSKRRAAKAHRAAKAQPAVRDGKETVRQKAAKKARSLKNVPGAFVRGH